MGADTITYLATNGAAPRKATLHGREHWVIPMTMLRPRVLNGSNGRLFYPADEISDPNVIDSWNGIPVTVRHPQVNGRHVSARRPEVYDRFGVGHVFGSSWTGGDHRAEAWVDVARLKAVENRLVREGQLRPEHLMSARLERGEPVEISTGLFTENEDAPGVSADGHEYDAVARNHRPDHLAILPDQRGACSLQDGCGLGVNSRNAPSKNGDDMATKSNRTADAAFLVANCDCWKGKADLLANDDAFTDEEVAALAANAREARGNALVANALADGVEVGGQVVRYDAKAQRLVAANAGTCAECGGALDGGTCNECGEGMTAEDEEEEAPPPPKKKAPPFVKNQDAGPRRPRVTQTSNSERTRPMTANEWLAQAPPEVREDVMYARKQRVANKLAIVKRIVDRFPVEEREAVYNEYKDLSEAELTRIDVSQAKVAANAAPAEDEMPPFYGAQGAPGWARLTDNEADDPLDLESAPWRQPAKS